MAITFPTTLDALTNPGATDKTTSPAHASQHSDVNDIIEALEAKVGVNSSAVTTSHDYKLSGVTGSLKASTVTGTETFTNKTMTSPRLNTPNVNEAVALAATSSELNITDDGETTEKVLNVKPKAFAVPTVDQLNPANGTATKVTLATEIFDVGGDFADSKFTAPVNGYYQVSGAVLWVNTTIVVHSPYLVQIFVDGSIYNNLQGIAHSGNTNEFIAPTVSGLVYMAANSYVELYAKQYTGAATSDIDATGTFMSVHLLSV